MNYDKYNWIGASLLESRLDSAYYSTEAVASALWMYSGQTKLTRIDRATTLVTDGTHQTPVYVTDGVPFLSSTNIDECSVNFSKGHKYVSLPDHIELKRAKCSPMRNDILIAKSGRVGTAAVNSAPFEFSVFEGIAIVRLNESFDPYFVTAFLNTHYSQDQIFRSQKGAVQKHLHLEELRELKFPDVAMDIQQAIGNKVRKAERLRELAETALTVVNERMSTVVPPYPSAPEPVAWTDTSFLTDRLDPQPYRSHTLALLKAIRQIRHTVLGKVCAVTGGCAVPSEEFTGDGIRLVRIRDIGVGNFEKPDVFLSESFCKDNKRYMAKEAMIVVGMDGSFRVQFFLPSDLPAMINQRVAVLNAHSMRPELVTAWLNRPEGQIQMLRRSVKTTVEHISLEDVRSVMLPRLDEDEENHLADKIRLARHHQSESVHLIDAAKADVEDLISNTLDLEALQTESTAIESWLAANPSPSATN